MVAFSGTPVLLNLQQAKVHFKFMFKLGEFSGKIVYNIIASFLVNCKVTFLAYVQQKVAIFWRRFSPRHS